MSEPGSAAAGFDCSRPSIARVYDYLLGGKDNYAADRELAERLLSQLPGIRANARANRAFLQRVVRAIAGAGVTQFLDIGTGLPTGENVHQVARSVRPSARVVYVDNDEVVAAHATALLATDEEAEFVLGDLREPQCVLARAEDLLDFRKPVAVLIISMLHFVPDDARARAIVAAIAERLVAGSYLAISHLEYRPADEAVTQQYAGAVADLARRGAREVAALLPEGWEPVEPGLVPVTAWLPPAGAAAEDTAMLGVVARKPQRTG
jgi:hypothetical protein